MTGRPVAENTGRRENTSMENKGLRKKIKGVTVFTFGSTQWARDVVTRQAGKEMGRGGILSKRRGRGNCWNGWMWEIRLIFEGYHQELRRKTSDDENSRGQRGG